MGILPAALRRPLLRRAAAVLTAVLLLMAGYAAGARSGPSRPSADSVDVGFVRDMIVHHSQAVTLAMIVVPRSTVPAVRQMAGEIAKTQEREAGTMTGWLQQWGLPVSTTGPAMSWMTHTATTAAGADPPMPGMATRQDVARLAVTRGRAADLLFCRLMLSHHLGGLHMIDEVIARGTRLEVIALAQQMRAVQEREVNQLNQLLAHLALPPARQR
jgi:uncharacterized protein (DUF305 family)